MARIIYEIIINYLIIPWAWEIDSISIIWCDVIINDTDTIDAVINNYSPVFSKQVSVSIVHYSIIMDKDIVKRKKKPSF